MLATIWNTLLFYPLLNVMMLLYHFVGENLGVAIIILAILLRLLLIPLVRKQTTMTKKMAGLKPQLEELQKKYKNNPQKLSQEQMLLYKKTGYNPLGCIGTMIPQLLVLYVLIGVIRAVTSGTLDGLYPWVQNLLGVNDTYTVNSMFLFWDLTQSYSGLTCFMSSNKECVPQYGKLAIEILPYIGLAVLVGITQYITTVFTQKMQAPQTPSKKKDPNAPLSPEDMQANMMKSMNFMFPIMTLFFTVSVPAALGVYWLIQSLMLVVQYFLLDFDKTKEGVQNLWNVLHKK